jgi:hypothetical protein
MDPNANLAEQLRLAREIQETVDQCNDDTVAVADNGIRLANLVLSLNEWISKGGFLPTAWQEKSKGYPRYYLVVKIDGSDEDVFITHGGFDTPAQANDYLKTCHSTIRETARMVRAEKPVRAVYNA